MQKKQKRPGRVTEMTRDPEGAIAAMRNDEVAPVDYGLFARRAAEIIVGATRMPRKGERRR